MAGPPPSAFRVVPAYAMRRSKDGEVASIGGDVSQGDAPPFPAAGWRDMTVPLAPTLRR